MPYIKKMVRVGWEVLDSFSILTPGVLNFVVSKICHNYIRGKGLTYNTLNEVIGVLECAKMELYRQVAAPYEDEKKAGNGPVSELDRG